MTRFYAFRFVSVCFHLSRPILLSISFIRVQFVSPFLPYPSRSRSFPVPLVSVSLHVSPFTVPGSPPILHFMARLCYKCRYSLVLNDRLMWKYIYRICFRVTVERSKGNPSFQPKTLTRDNFLVFTRRRHRLCQTDFCHMSVLDALYNH